MESSCCVCHVKNVLDLGYNPGQHVDGRSQRRRHWCPGNTETIKLHPIVDKKLIFFMLNKNYDALVVSPLVKIQPKQKWNVIEGSSTCLSQLSTGVCRI